MIELTFYGGINEIGGNKVLLEDGSRALLLDFGFPYKTYKRFYEEYLRPRGGAGLLDPLTMNLLPPLDGLYRPDLASPDLWSRFRHSPAYRHAGDVQGVLLSHAHLDHSGHIAFLKHDIPVYATAMTAFITKAMQDSGKSDFDQQVCYYTPTVYDRPTGWTQEAYLSDSSAPRRQRCFRLGDVSPDQLSAEAHQFWSSGFWQKTGRQKALDSCPLSTHHDCGFELRCFPVDHSIPGACAWAVNTSSGWVVYSGDLRLHGKRGALTERFIESAARLDPQVLILEGTNVLRDTGVSEGDVFDNALSAVASSNSLVIADFSARDIDRLLTFLDIARQTNRKLAVLPRDAYLLRTLRLLDQQVPDVSEDENLVVYQETTASRSPAFWLRQVYDDYKSKTVLADDVHAAQDQFILCFSFFDLDELPSIRPAPGSLYVYSSSEPHDEEQEIDFRRLHAWLDHFGLKGFGVPFPSAEGWEVPQDQRGVHASGHAPGPDLLRIVQEVRPRKLIPIHTEHPEFYVESLRRSDIEVVLPAIGRAVQV